jgi:Ala-tRNA(Pro) deacylase
MKELLGVTPGSVTPLGLLNDTNCRVKFFIDKDFADGMIGVHPNENTATVWMQTADLIRIVKEHGNEVQVM